MPGKTRSKTFGLSLDAQPAALTWAVSFFSDIGAQFLIKTSANQMASITIESLLTNWALWGGLALYGISTGLLILALRDGELSLLYPVISLTYVWVTVLSVTVFDERLTMAKAVGISIIVLGVGLLGKGRE
jgi:multidrug transporter EmrE-like cation transporter